jgi:hypothetical protein
MAKIFHRKFSAIFFQKISHFLKSSLNISFFNLFLVALGLGGFESCRCSYLTVAVCCVKPKATRKRLKKEILSDDFNKRKIFWKNIAENFPYGKIFHFTSLLAVGTERYIHVVKCCLIMKLNVHIHPYKTLRTHEGYIKVLGFNRPIRKQGNTRIQLIRSE